MHDIGLFFKVCDHHKKWDFVKRLGYGSFVPQTR